MAEGYDGTGLASSLTDLMTSLAIVFVLLFVATLNNVQQESRQTVNAVLVSVRAHLQTYLTNGVQVDADPRDPLGVLVLVPEGLLQFGVNDATIPQPGLEFLRRFTPSLATAACAPEFKHEVDSIVVEGHTDTTGSDAINLPLSQGRSMAVVRELLRVLEASDREAGTGLKPCIVDRLSASGRGSAEPILDSAGHADDARSRRVVFKIRVRSLEQRGLHAVFGSDSSSTRH